MTLDALATTDDLTARGVTVPDGIDADALLAAASSAVRDAAGCPISQTTSIIDLPVDDPYEISLPAGPVTVVSSLAIDGTAVAASTLTGGVWSDGWRKWGDTLLLKGVTFYAPATATVTYTHGYVTVPDDVVDLVCAMTAMALGDTDSYGAASRLAAFRLGEFSENYIHPAGTDSPSPMALPDTVRARLHARFSGTAITVRVR